MEMQIWCLALSKLAGFWAFVMLHETFSKLPFLPAPKNEANCDVWPQPGLINYLFGRVQPHDLPAQISPTGPAYSEALRIA